MSFALIVEINDCFYECSVAIGKLPGRYTIVSTETAKNVILKTKSSVELLIPHISFGINHGLQSLRGLASALGCTRTTSVL